MLIMTSQMTSPNEFVYIKNIAAITHEHASGWTSFLNTMQVTQLYTVWCIYDNVYQYE